MRSLGRFCRGPSRRSPRGAGPSPRVFRHHPPSLRVHTAPSRMDSASKQEAQSRSRHNERRSSGQRINSKPLVRADIIPGDCVFQPGLIELFRRKEGANGILAGTPEKSKASRPSFVFGALPSAHVRICFGDFLGFVGACSALLLSLLPLLPEDFRLPLPLRPPLPRFAAKAAMRA